MKLKYTVLLPHCVEGVEASRRQGVEAATVFTYRNKVPDSNLPKFEGMASTQ